MAQNQSANGSQREFQTEARVRMRDIFSIIEVDVRQFQLTPAHRAVTHFELVDARLGYEMQSAANVSDKLRSTSAISMNHDKQQRKRDASGDDLRKVYWL